MSLLERRPDRYERLAVANGRHKVFRVVLARPVEGLAHRDPKAIGRQAGGQAIDRHDPPDVEHLVVVAFRLEVGVVEGELPAEMLELPGNDDAIARVEPSLDVAAPEPGRLDGPRVILEQRDRPLDTPPERRLDPNVDDADPGADDAPLLRLVQLAELAHLAQVVVAPREVKEQLTDGEEPEATTRTAEKWPGTETGPRQLRVEQLSRVGRRGRKRRGCRLARLRGRHPPTRRR